jgi:hypothetical protein
LPALKVADAALKDRLLFADIDDVTIAGLTEEVAAAFQAFESFLVDSGLRINTTKSFIFALDFPYLSTLTQRNNFNNSPRRPKESLSLALRSAP